MGLLDPTLLRNLKGLTGLLAETPIGKYVRGKDQGLSVDGLRRGLLSIPVFENTPEANQTAYEAAMNIGPLGLGKIVYHGSPHKFDKFDASKIGTGEGAQAYGHGVYLADSEGVAKTYTSVNQPAYLNAGVRAIVDDVMKEAAEKGLKGKEARLWANHEITRLAMERPEYARRQWFDAANNIDDILDKPVGSLYKADLPDEWIPKMLDWDKPLKEQPEVLKALESHPTMGKGSMGWRGAPEGLWERAMSSPTRTGEWLYREIANNAPKETADALQQAGIPGIRYLDGGSRGKGQGSYNYVVFPGLEDQVKILERNGVPLGLLGGK